MRGILITVRSASTRLNNKCYKPIKGRPTIEYVIEQAKKSKLGEVVVFMHNGVARRRLIV